MSVAPARNSAESRSLWVERRRAFAEFSSGASRSRAIALSANRAQSSETDRSDASRPGFDSDGRLCGTDASIEKAKRRLINTIGGYTVQMAHIERDRKKLLNRVRRIRGQVEGIEKALESGEDCSPLLQTIAATRGALNGLMAQVLEGHIREHVIDPAQGPTHRQLEAADELVDVVKAYLK